MGAILGQVEYWSAQVVTWIVAVGLVGVGIPGAIVKGATKGIERGARLAS